MQTQYTPCIPNQNQNQNQKYFINPRKKIVLTRRHSLSKNSDFWYCIDIGHSNWNVTGTNYKHHIVRDLVGFERDKSHHIRRVKDSLVTPAWVTYTVSAAVAGTCRPALQLQQAQSSERALSNKRPQRQLIYDAEATKTKHFLRTFFHCFLPPCTTVNRCPGHSMIGWSFVIY